MENKVLQLVDRDAIEAYRQGGETEHLRVSHKKEVLEPSTRECGNSLDS